MIQQASSDRSLHAAQLAFQHAPVRDLSQRACVGFRLRRASDDRLVVNRFEVLRQFFNNLQLALRRKMQRHEMFMNDLLPIRHR